MCDSLVAVPPATADGAVWIAKNSDREPSEAQVVEHHLPRRAPGARLRATYLELDDVAETEEVVISRPAWMWGAEMGVNAKGVAIGNEAVFTRLPVAETGLLGMDLVRLALERASTAEEALLVITELLARHGQGGRAGHRNQRFRYHNAFLIADRTEAWVLETADRFWAAEKVDGVRTISNALSIGTKIDRLGPGTFEHARDRGWVKRASDLHFADVFDDPLYTRLSGGSVRRACTTRRLEDARGAIDRAVLMAALRSHEGRAVDAGVRLEMPCAHASWIPTRHAGQTTASMIARLGPTTSTAPGAGLDVWLTGTSSPCLSVFKPVALGLERPLELGPSPSVEGADRDSLFWRHERLHRAVLEGWEARSPRAIAARTALEAKVLAHPLPSDAEPRTRMIEAVWAEHRELLPAWLDELRSIEVPRGRSPFHLWWRGQDRRDGLHEDAR